MSMTIEYLAELGQKRIISSLFERMWTADGRSNPVVTAMQIVENKRISRNRKSSGFATLFVACCLAVVVVLMYREGFKETLLWYVSQEIFIVAALIEIYNTLEKKDEEVGSDGVCMVNEFCEHLNLVSKWVVTRTGYYLFCDEDKIRKVGTDILFASAYNVLNIEDAEKEEMESYRKLLLQESVGNARAEFTRRYNTLREIGMASGGYDKYFAMVRKQREAEQERLWLEQQKAQTAASPA